MARKQAVVGTRAEVVGWGPVEVTEVVVGDYRSTTRRYVRAACPQSPTGWVLLPEVAFLKLLPEVR
jgi:hypothetical protein